MKQSKDALSKHATPRKGVSETEKTARPTEAWKKNLMEDIRRQPLPRRPLLRPMPLLFAFFALACCAALYFWAFR